MKEAGTKPGLLQKINFAIGKLCRIGTRQMRLSSLRRQRRRYLQNLGERLYVFKVLQKEEDVWDKEEISQLLLTLADLDQEQELLLQEISDIRSEDLDYGSDEDLAPAAAPASAPESEEPAGEKPAAEESAPAAPTAEKAGEEKPADVAGEAEDKPAPRAKTAARTRTRKTAGAAARKTAAKSPAKNGTKTTRRKTAAGKTATGKKPAAKPAGGEEKE